MERHFDDQDAGGEQKQAHPHARHRSRYFSAHFPFEVLLCAGMARLMEFSRQGSLFIQKRLQLALLLRLLKTKNSRRQKGDSKGDEN